MRDQSLRLGMGKEENIFERVRGREQQTLVVSVLLTAWNNRLPSFPQSPGSQENLTVKYGEKEKNQNQKPPEA